MPSNNPLNGFQQVFMPFLQWENISNSSMNLHGKVSIGTERLPNRHGRSLRITERHYEA